MGQKDLSTKEFLGWPDVFADTGNALLYGGEERLGQEDLSPAPTETFYEGEDGKLHGQFQDVSMYEERDGYIRALYTYENQTRPERLMILRKAGYCGGVYRMQLKAADNGAKRESGMDSKKESGKKSGKSSRKVKGARPRVFPCIGIVLYWGKGRWRQPQSMEELFADEEWYGQDSPYIDNIRLHVFEMRHLSREVRSRFRSDMRFVVDYLAEDEENLPRHQKVRHVEELLRLLKEVTGDERYGEIIDSLLQRQEERGAVEMCEILDKYINRGMEQGLEAGRKQGIEQGLEAGRKQGLEAGRKQGLEDGRKQGLEAGRKQGLEDGRKQGLEAGRKQGLEAGRKQGIEQGETLLARLITCLLRDNRNGDIVLAASDEGKRQVLYREYGLL